MAADELENQDDQESQAGDSQESAPDQPATDDAQTAVADVANDQPQENIGQDVPDLPDFSDMLSEAANSSIDLLKDVELNVKIELGRAEMTVDEILKLNSGAVVELNKLAGDPVDVFVNEQLIARGEVLVLNDNFCVRINEIIPGMSERINQD